MGKHWIKITFFMVLLFLSHSSIVYGETSNAMTQNENENNYTIAPVFGTTQKQATSNFYDMTLHPNQTDTFKLVINNQSKEAQTFKVAVNTATTNQNGIVDYTEASFEKDPSMTLSLKELVTPNTQEVTVAAGQSTTINFNISMPSQAFDGILLGGVTVRPQVKEQNKSGLQNIYMHTLALRVNETEKEIPAKLIGGKVTIGQENRHNQVAMLLRNPQPKLLTEITGEFSITKKGSSQKLVHTTKKDMSIAPNSQFMLPIPLNDDFHSGTYTYTVQLKNKNGSWHFSKDFTVDQKAASKYNATSVDQPKQSTFSWWKTAVVVILIILLCLICYRFGKNASKK
ncbi:DUF916 and DUF3324 domain-containing protein [Enterococcus faecalis]